MEIPATQLSIIIQGFSTNFIAVPGVIGPLHQIWNTTYDQTTSKMVACYTEQFLNFYQFMMYFQGTRSIISILRYGY